jgi:hypothetical protein
MFPPKTSFYALHGILDGTCGVYGLQHHHWQLALTIRLSQLGMTQEQVQLNPRLAGVHWWSFAAFVQQNGPGVPRPVWPLNGARSAYDFFVHHPDANEVLPFCWMQKDPLAQLWKHRAVRATPVADPNAEYILQPVAPTVDDPSFTALASIVLNRPALFWEALQLRQRLSHHVSTHRSSQTRTAMRLLDLSYQRVADSLLGDISELFGIAIIVCVEMAPHNFHPLYPQGASGTGYIWRNVHGTVGAFCYTTPAGKVNFRVPSQLATQYAIPQEYHQHISSLHRQWEWMVRNLHATLLSGGAQFPALDGNFSTIYDVAASLFRNVIPGSVAVLAVELRQVCAFLIRSRVDTDQCCKPYQEWLAWHVSYSAQTASTWQLYSSAPAVLDLELSVLADLLGIEIRFRAMAVVDIFLETSLGDPQTVIAVPRNVRCPAIALEAIWNSDSDSFQQQPFHLIDERHRPSESPFGASSSEWLPDENTCM